MPDSRRGAFHNLPVHREQGCRVVDGLDVPHRYHGVVSGTVPGIAATASHPPSVASPSGAEVAHYQHEAPVQQFVAMGGIE
jgi:hypothetical protein